MHSLLDRSVPLGYGNTKLLARRRLPGEGRADADSEPDPSRFGASARPRWQMSGSTGYDGMVAYRTIRMLSWIAERSSCSRATGAS